MSDNRIELENEADYSRTLEIERDIMRETGYALPTRDKFITFTAPELADAIRARLRKEGVKFQ